MTGHGWTKGARVAVALLDGTDGYTPTGRYDRGTVHRVTGASLLVRFDDGTYCEIAAAEARPELDAGARPMSGYRVRPAHAVAAVAGTVAVLLFSGVLGDRVGPPPSCRAASEVRIIVGQDAPGLAEGDIRCVPVDALSSTGG